MSVWPWQSKVPLPGMFWKRVSTPLLAHDTSNLICRICEHRNEKRWCKLCELSRSTVFRPLRADEPASAADAPKEVTALKIPTYNIEHLLADQKHLLADQKLKVTVAVEMPVQAAPIAKEEEAKCVVVASGAKDGKEYEEEIIPRRPPSDKPLDSGHEEELELVYSVQKSF